MMNSYNLKKIHELISFENKYSNEEDYMTEANNLAIIDLDTTPLYEINKRGRILFTPKLHYYALLIEIEINRHINEVSRLLENENNFDLTKFVMKTTREAVTTLVHKSSRYLLRNDGRGIFWNKIISENPEYYNFGRDKELVVFHHYLIAQLARCWLELQDRYSGILGNERYDVDLFYSTYVKRTPDAIFGLRKIDNNNQKNKNVNISRPDCCFLYNNEEYFAIAIQEFTNKLKYYELIPNDIDYKMMESLFLGRPCRVQYKWLKDNHILTHIIKELTKKDKNGKSVISTWPNGVSKWEVVSNRFVDKDNNPLPNIRQETIRKKQKYIIDEVVHALKNYI